MMFVERAVLVLVVALAAFPAGLALANLWLYRRPTLIRRSVRPALSLLVPARNEAASIRHCVESALASTGVTLEVVVMDDASTDGTAEIVGEIAARDPRVRLESAPPLPDGWNGKQHACARLAEVARNDVLVFIDADVRLTPGGLARAVDFLDASGSALVSGIPRQRTGSWAERLVIPLIHFILLGFLPLGAMRRSPRASFAAGCGQLFIARREAYEAVGGHARIRGSRHDGVTLPRAFRRAGYRTDLFDATRVATCRMYRSAREVWLGFAKNADEGMANPAAIGPWTLLLFGGQIAPWLVLGVALQRGDTLAAVAAGCAAAAGVAIRLIFAWRFRQSWLGALLHPVGVAIVLAIQYGSMLGRDVAWKGRVPVDG